MSPPGDEHSVSNQDNGHSSSAADQSDIPPSGTADVPDQPMTGGGNQRRTPKSLSEFPEELLLQICYAVFPGGDHRATRWSREYAKALSDLSRLALTCTTLGRIACEPLYRFIRVESHYRFNLVRSPYYRGVDGGILLRTILRAPELAGLIRHIEFDHFVAHAISPVPGAEDMYRQLNDDVRAWCQYTICAPPPHRYWPFSLHGAPRFLSDVGWGPYNFLAKILLHAASRAERVSLDIGDIDQRELHLSDGGFLAATAKPVTLESTGRSTNLAALERFVQLQDLRCANLYNPEGQLGQDIHLGNLKRVRLTASLLDIDALQDLIGRVRQLEHFELYSLVDALAPWRVPSLEAVLECLMPHKNTLTTFGFLAGHEQWPPSPAAVAALAGFPNMRALALGSMTLFGVEEDHQIGLADLFGLLYSMTDALENFCIFGLNRMVRDEFNSFANRMIAAYKHPERLSFLFHPRLIIAEVDDVSPLVDAGIRVVVESTSRHCPEPEDWLDGDWITNG
ncbi:hypothetical protein QBC42DRAFT_292269 [Cladorrhinum samala]|uniref:F-box domain-containing protein n=1 Tax=Cladorrhinum samala TaxID=585594 RepID=A0AAV9HB83_9PEZI|nr:hypothetical protein QBC42DRAFT_292269 [Cladorrhinum samala]